MNTAQELFPVKEPSASERRTIEIGMLYHHLKEQKTYSPNFIRKLLTREYFLEEDSVQIYRILGKYKSFDDTLKARFDPEKAGVFFRIVMKGQLEKFLPK